jgi:CheY-like chemotaxis protein
MQEADDFQRPAKPIFFESSTMSSANASTILVVEDDAIVRMLIVDVLEELEFKVLEADGSEQALETLKDVNQHIDLMMTDVGLPVMDGRELANQARALRPALPILFASGYAENIDVPQGMHLIGKPFSIDQLRDKVKSILG